MGTATPPPPPTVARALPLGPPVQVEWSSTPLTEVLTDTERAQLALELKRYAARITASLKTLEISEVQRQSLTITVRQFVLLTDTLNENALLNCEQTAGLLRRAQVRASRNDKLLMVVGGTALFGWGAAVVLAMRLVEALGL